MTGLVPAAATAPSSLAVRVLTVPPAASWLLCEVSGFSPPDILLTWLRGHAEVDATGFGTAPPMPQPGNTTFQTWSVLRVLAAQGPLPATYTCVVRHDASRKVLNASWSLDTGESHTDARVSPPPPASASTGWGEGQPPGAKWPQGCATGLLGVCRASAVGCGCPDTGPLNPVCTPHAGLGGLGGAVSPARPQRATISPQDMPHCWVRNGPPLVRGSSQTLPSRDV